MGIRKNAAHLTVTERDDFLDALLALKSTIANPLAAVAQQISIYDQFVAIHLYTLSINFPGGGPVNMGHSNSGFCPWHRYYLLQFEQALQAVNPSVTLPYWDWTDHTSTQTLIFQDDFMGPNGGAGGVGGGSVQSGFFTVADWPVKTQLQQGHGATLQRSFQAFGNLEVQASVQNCLGPIRNTYENPNGFRPYLEGGGNGNQMHNGMHLWIGGNMADADSSPNDPIFFMHHCNIDRLWAMWQIDGHQGDAFYPDSGRPEGHNLDNLMWPWVAATPGYSSNNVQVDIVLPNFAAQPSITPADVLDHRALGYAYDTEVIMGIALDQTGSMLGLTPDPMTGMAPNITKWQAAKQGVSSLLFDCEAAYDAKEAYVTAGVETFRTVAGVNTFTQIFPGDHFGIVKNMGVITQATFDANIAAQIPDGNTPLAGALTDTENNLVRAPFSNLPAGEQRYLSMLTDGKETAAPLLNTLGLHSFADTIIFAMGFGIGGGWDGVDYASIATITTKGKTAPPGVTLAYHGENAGVIDKFYADAVAASLGFAPSVDPVFDLYPGENVHVRFDVTDADQVVMITAQGFDFSDKNWDFCLMAPDGSHCGDTRDTHNAGHRTKRHSHGNNMDVLSPFLVTMKQRHGRCTIFLNRNGADSHQWVGRWALMAFYKADPAEHVMVMASVSDLLLPTGAPPVKGPLYSRIFQTAAKRLPVRAIAGKPAHSLAIGLPGITTTSTEPPCAVSINIYNKTSLQAVLNSTVRAAFAGEDIALSLDLSDRAGGTFSINFIAARLVAPNYSLGNALADIKRIPVRSRRKFINNKNPQEPFDIVRYLAEYEKINPKAFPVRDEIVEFKQNKDGSWAAAVKNNRYPGIYRVALYVEGVYSPKKQHHQEHCCEEGPQRFSKVLQTVVALGIKPDSAKSKLKLQWVTRNKFAVSITPTDSLGNVVLPLAGLPPVLMVNKIRVLSKTVNEYTGEYKMYVTVTGKFIISRDGITIKEGEAVIETLSGEKLVLKAGDTLKISVQVAGTVLVFAKQQLKNKS